MIVQQPRRVYLGADNQMAVYVRSDSGRMDLSGATVKVRVKGQNGNQLAEFDATGSEGGRVAYTVTTELAEQHLGPGVFIEQVVADGEIVATGILEVVG